MIENNAKLDSEITKLNTECDIIQSIINKKIKPSKLDDKINNDLEHLLTECKSVQSAITDHYKNNKVVKPTIEKYYIMETPKTKARMPPK